MTDEEIIKNWNMGLTKLSVARVYMEDFNKKVNKKAGGKRINMNQALAHVEPIMFKYRMGQFK